MVIQLIAKDKNEKFQFQGKCKLIIDSLSKMLLVEPYNEEFKMISAMFKWEFLALKNILFVFAENDFQDFALIFDGPIKCHKAYGILVKKGATAGNKEMIPQRFLPSIFNEISGNNESNLKMKEIFLKWIKFFDGKEKEKYIQILKDYNVYDLFYSNMVGDLQKNHRKRKAKDITYGKESKNGSTSYRLNNKNSKKGCSDKQQNLPVLSKIIDAPNFEILKYIQNGHSRIKLSIFPDSNDRKYCFEYYWLKSRSCYICYGCYNNGKTLNAKIIKRNGKDIVQLNETQHICKIQEYKTIIEKPNYDLLSYEHGESISERLIIFLDSSRTFCYEYYCRTLKIYSCCGCVSKRHLVGAYICQKEDGTEFIMLKSSNHVCDPRQFNPEKYGKKEIVEADNFKFFKNFQNGIDKSKLVIFTTSNQTTCYEYFSNNSTNNFLCCGCRKQKKWISANICKNENGNDYLKLSNAKHVCEPHEYDPEKYEFSKSEVVESSNFKIFNYKHHGKSISKLIVFDPTNMNLCYEYFFNPFAKIYQCCRCPRKNEVSATVFKNDKGNENLILSKAQHICELLEFDPDKYKDDVIINKSMYNFTSTIIGNINNQILIIFTSQEKKFYHKFIYFRKMKYFYCSKCYSSSKIHITTATLQNEGKENEFAYVSNQKHICEPFESLINGNIIMAPNFQLTYKSLKGKGTQHLVVFTNDEKTDFYDYSWNKDSNKFICYACHNHYKIHVYAKIFKNDENQECVELSSRPHQCNPINYEIHNANIVKLPNFKLYETAWGKKIFKRLAIFKSSKMGYIYSYDKRAMIYICQKCIAHKTRVTAKVFQDENGEDYLELNKNEHVCEMQKI